MDEMIDTFLAVTDTADRQVAEQFLEMAGNDMDTAVSLFYEHGAPAGASGGIPVDDDDDDAALAARLQNEAYQDVRAPEEAVHEQLVDSFSAGPMAWSRPEQAIFGDTPVGIFNQRYNQDFPDDEDDEFFDEDELDDDDDSIIELDDDDNVIDLEAEEQVRTRRLSRRQRQPRGYSTMTSSQRRLANIFRPPWDIIEKLSLDLAKMKARQEKKWILINIQDMGDFQCQVLNRDFWANSDVKDVVRSNFLFLQYHNTSPSGTEYSNFYPFTGFPHIAILDPMTGERLKVWDNRVPKVADWISDVVDFLSRFSLEPGHKNPTVKHEQTINVDALSEEQQINLAVQQSMNNSTADLNGGDKENPISLDSDADADVDAGDAPKESGELTEAQILASIKPIAHEEPKLEPGTTTRVQIRSGDGKRVVRVFKLDDTVRTVYEFVKATFDGLSEPDTEFVLTSQRQNLISELDKTIAEAGLKNATVLLEVTT